MTPHEIAPEFKDTDHDFKYGEEKKEIVEKRMELRKKYPDALDYIKAHDGLCLTKEACQKLFDFWTTCHWYGPCNSDKSYYYVMPGLCESGHVILERDTETGEETYYRLSKDPDQEYLDRMEFQAWLQNNLQYRLSSWGDWKKPNVISAIFEDKHGQKWIRAWKEDGPATAAQPGYDKDPIMEEMPFLELPFEDSIARMKAYEAWQAQNGLEKVGHILNSQTLAKTMHMGSKKPLRQYKER